MKFADKTRFAFNSSINPAMSFYKTDGSTIYCNIGVSKTFPINTGDWSGKTNPITNIHHGGAPGNAATGATAGDGAFYICGANTNDIEGYFLTLSGHSMAFSNPADNYSIRFYDEDTGDGNPAIGAAGHGWHISATGSINGFSDSRVKTDVKTYKHSDFETYKQLRTITYKQKKPSNLKPERANKQSCIDKYNNEQYGVIAQELYKLYPELETTGEIRDRQKWEYRRDNWDNGVHETEHKQWEEAKKQYEEVDQKDSKDKHSFRTKEPPKIFDEEEPMKMVDYSRLSLLTIGVVQDLITENEILKSKVASLESQMIDVLNRLQTLEKK